MCELGGLLLWEVLQIDVNPEVQVLAPEEILKGYQMSIFELRVLHASFFITG